MGIQVPVVHTQIHRTPPRQTEPKRQFLSTLAPLTACVAGNKDDLSSYYTLAAAAAAHQHGHAAHAHAAHYAAAAAAADFNMSQLLGAAAAGGGVPEGAQQAAGQAAAAMAAQGLALGGPGGVAGVGGAGGGGGEEARKVAPDVIAGTPGQETSQQDELAAFAQAEAKRTEQLKKRYAGMDGSSSSASQQSAAQSQSAASSDDDEQNDYGFNKRPSVRGIKPKFSSTNEILAQMQEQLTQHVPTTVISSQPVPQAVKGYAIPNTQPKQLSQNPSPQNVPQPQQQQQQAAQQAAQLQQHQQHQQQAAQLQQQMAAAAAAAAMQANTIAQQKTEQRSTWSFYSESGEQQRFPVDAAAAAAIQQTYYQTLPAGAMFRQTMIQQGATAGGADDASLLYAAAAAAQNCQSVTASATATALEQSKHGGSYSSHFARSPTRRPESPPPLRNYHQTMVLIPYNAETYSQFATSSSVDPKLAHIQRQNILEYQQVSTRPGLGEFAWGTRVLGCYGYSSGVGGFL